MGTALKNKKLWVATIAVFAAIALSAGAVAYAQNGGFSYMRVGASDRSADDLFAGFELETKTVLYAEECHVSDADSPIESLDVECIRAYATLQNPSDGSRTRGKPADGSRAYKKHIDFEYGLAKWDDDPRFGPPDGYVWAEGWYISIECIPENEWDSERILSPGDLDENGVVVFCKKAVPIDANAEDSIGGDA